VAQGLIRKPAAFISTISHGRGQELLYGGLKISEVCREDIALGGVVSLLWFKRYVFLLAMFRLDRLHIAAGYLGISPWATKFVEMVLMLTAGHGSALSGVMNTIVATRAGKDLISSLAFGLLTISSRFGVCDVT
jgi:ATP citrate (pro-S)-lyase